MAKKTNVATKKQKGMIIYLKNGVVAKVGEGNEFASGDFDYAVVAKANGNEITDLELYDKEKNCNIVVNSALMSAFSYDCGCSRTSFLGEMEKLRESFLAYVKKACLKKEEKTEVKKFMYAAYVEAKEKVS